LNGFDSLAITKLDVLDGLESLNICTGYEILGNTYDHLPSIAEDLEKIIPIYETLPGWNESTSHITEYEELPENAKNYLKRIEDLCKVRISLISIGKERDHFIVIQDPFSKSFKLEKESQLVGAYPV